MEIVATERKDAEKVVVLIFCKTDNTPEKEDANGSGHRFCIIRGEWLNNNIKQKVGIQNEATITTLFPIHRA
jgi:hypothetical protein